MDPTHVQPLSIAAGVITVSSSRNESNDTSGALINELLAADGIPLRYYTIVPDRIDAIRGAVITALESCNCVVLSGGTGLTHDDCTIEAVTPLLEKKIDGFGELFRMKSYDEIGTASMLSRAIAGITGGKVIFCIPGSTKAVRLAVGSLILPEIRHILTHANK
ncbi:molybdenum cofactor biosynthesis protein B [Methanolinea mesophila]|uniref:MogA/MoaB family molybdenum cofactor biosynthesis protein n=1 Tax=Methanolinea mesophila TaxID=547055 RepID=UPI001AE200A7|nr:MogA/MoaB family molybdenum cofactor biosynthesis protein [Methanolinea mesophila]MBP1928803.1 molybdenum cofactor biosynthesis protein B [Methanolinea mesophila]